MSRSSRSAPATGHPPAPGRGSPRLEGLFCRSVRVAGAVAIHGLDDLSPSERSGLERAAAARQQEYATARVLARHLLRAMGQAETGIRRDSDGVPVWPSDIVGTITHSRGRCAVAVGSRRDHAGLGLDLEPDLPVSVGLESRVAGPAERRWIADARGDERGRRCRVVFSAKEAVYKAYFPRLRERWGFLDVELEVDLEAGRFRARLPASADRSEVSGRVRREDGWIVTAVADPA